MRPGTAGRPSAIFYPRKKEAAEKKEAEAQAKGDGKDTKVDAPKPADKPAEAPKP